MIVGCVGPESKVVGATVGKSTSSSLGIDSNKEDTKDSVEGCSPREGTKIGEKINTPR